MQYVIDALVASIGTFGSLNRRDAGWLFHDAYQAMVAGRAGAVGAGIDIRDVIADRAKAQISLKAMHRLCQRSRIFIARAQDMKCEPLGAFGAHPGQLLQFFNQPGHWLCIT